MFSLIDGNNFFCSCERLFRPDLENKPVVVLSGNDGCVIARSNEVKALGIPMAAPYYQVKDLLARHNAAVFSSNFTLYADLSSRMMHIIRSFVPRMEVYSIDEAFADVAGLSNVPSFALDLQQTIKQWIGIPTSIGIGPTKTLAKVANAYSKKDLSLKGICHLNDTQDMDEVLQRMPVKDIWGVGRRLSEHFSQRGIHTALDLKHTSPRRIREAFSVVEERIVHELNGISCLPLTPTPDPKQSIQVTRSLSKDVTSLEDLKGILATHVTRLGEKLRGNNLMTDHMLIFMRTNRFQSHRPQCRLEGEVRFQSPCYDTHTLIKGALESLEKNYKKGYAYHKVGVMALRLCHPSQATSQGDLFSNQEETKHKGRLRALSQVMDQVNQRFGKESLRYGVCHTKPQGIEEKGFLSKAYTTSWEDLLVVL